MAAADSGNALAVLRLPRLIAMLALAVAATTATPAVTPAATTAIGAAEASATRWLGLIDAGQYVAAWNAAASYLHATVAEAQWISSVAQVRAAAGALQSRQLKSAYQTSYLPGAPYGHYTVVYFVSRFAKRSAASETLTLMRDSAGGWRVVGYYLN